MKLLFATCAALLCFTGVSLAQTAGSIGFSGGALADSGVQSTTGSLSAAAPGAGLTFGAASSEQTASTTAGGIGGFGVVGTGLVGGGAAGSSSESTNESVTAGGSLGTAASASLGGGDAASGGLAWGFGGFGIGGLGN